MVKKSECVCVFMCKFATIIQSKATIFFFIHSANIDLESIIYARNCALFIAVTIAHANPESFKQWPLQKWILLVLSDSVQPHRRQPARLCHPWDSPGKNTGVGCHFLLQCKKVKSEREVAQSCLTLRDPMDCSLPGSSVHGIFQARVLEWGAIAFSEVECLGHMINLCLTF